MSNPDEHKEDPKPRPFSRYLAPKGECPTCDEIRAKGETLYPPHYASEYCKSARNAHCTCDICF